MSSSSNSSSYSSSSPRVLEWELGLPSDEELTPISQTLIPPSLASAFSIPPISMPAGDGSAADTRRAKRPRLSWTPQLHRRFVEVVSRLGMKAAVPKTIMDMMNVEGLTRENVASHLQKYRLYLKRVGAESNLDPDTDPHQYTNTVMLGHGGYNGT